MYPKAGLKELAARKVVLRARIATRRAESVAAFAQAAQGIAWIDRVIALGRRLAPLASVSLGLLAARLVSSRRNVIGTILRGVPLVASAAWILRSLLSWLPHQANRPS